MPDGSDIQNAFDWDFTQHVDGERVYGETTDLQRQAWWTVSLEADTAYVFQTRLPQEFDTYLYLYDPDTIPTAIRSAATTTPATTAITCRE